MFAFDSDMKITLWSPSMERMLGISYETAVGKSVLEILFFLEKSGEFEVFRKTLQGSSSQSVNQSYLIPQTQKSGFFDADYHPLVSDGEVTGVVAIWRDTTQRRLAEEILHESENRFRTMADSAPVLLWMSGTDSLCDFFNQSWLEFTGRTLEQEMGVGWAEGVYPEDLERCMSTYLTSFHAREAFTMEYRLRRKDGEYRWLIDRGIPRYSSDGTFLGYIGSCIDISELKEALQSRDRFISIASHELKTPLTSLKLQAQLFEKVSNLGRTDLQLQRLDRMNKTMIKQIERLEKLVTDMLDIAQIESGKLILTEENVDLRHLVEDVVERHAIQLKDAGYDFQVERWGEVGSCTWDHSRIDQVISNLLSNAIKFGSMKPIHISYGPKHDKALIQIKDQGIGIASRDQQRIFNRFERATSESEFSGLGLGLYISHKIAVAHGGSIIVESELGQGSTFTVELPLKPSSLSAIQI